MLVQTLSTLSPYPQGKKLLGRKDVKTTMIYTHVLQRGGLAVKSPLDDMDVMRR